MYKKAIYKKFILFSICVFVLLIFLGPVSAQESPKVLFDESGSYLGKYFTINNIGPTGTSTFANLLEENGFSVSRLDEQPVTYNKLKDYKVIIMILPYRNYTDSEIIAIKDYVKNGGGLFLVGSSFGVEDGGPNAIFNRIARSFGVDYAFSQTVNEPVANLGPAYFFKVTDIRPSPINTNIKDLFLVTSTYLKNPGNSTPVAYSSSNSWADVSYFSPEQGYSAGNTIKDSNETNGPFPLYSVMNYGKGKIVFSGSAFSFTNVLIYRSNAWKLGLNSVYWLSNQPIPANYKTAGPISFSIGYTLYRILGTIVLAIILITALFFLNRREKRIESTRIIKTIKNWKYIGLSITNIIFIILGVVLFFPINLYLFDSTVPQLYDPYFGYSLIVVGILFVLFSGYTLFNMIFRQRLIPIINYIIIAVLLFFSGYCIFLINTFSFPYMEYFTIGSLILLIPFIVNLWVIRGHGSDIIVEGKEFNRLSKLSVKSLPYELHGIYKDASYLGEGGFGRVYKALRGDGQEVALKIPKSFDKRAEKTFVAEVSNWSQLKHPNIVKLYDFKILPIPYLEMEYCEGSVHHGKKELNEAIKIIYESAQALKYAHGKNIIHGDIKTSNIMIKEGRYKISDWGLSKSMIDESITLSGATPQYAAPEQISHTFGRADERTDIYQLGTVFYEMITGKLPFEGEIAEIYSSILETQPIKPTELNPEAVDVESIIMKCLNKKKDDRYASMDEMIKDLENYYKPEKIIDQTVILSEDDKYDI